jgi:hypothetical protein
MRAAILGRLGVVLVVTASAALAAESPAGAPAPAPTPPPPTPTPDLVLGPRPDVVEPPIAEDRWRHVELGFDGGLGRRPGDAGKVHYGLSSVWGMHARIEILRWLGARALVQLEHNSVSFDDGALGLPEHTTYEQSDLSRILLGAELEPTWSPMKRLDLFAGCGIGWGRTTAEELQTGGPQTVSLPIRSAVFVEVPFSVGGRFEVLPNWVELTLSATLGVLSNQSGALFTPENTPGKSGTLVTVGGFPELGTSWNVLAGVGVLL